jgi:hypothetical protein
MLMPLMSLSTLLSCTFILDQRLMRALNRTAGFSTKFPLCRHNLRAIRISSVG